jgi:hypothetical protein
MEVDSEALINHLARKAYPPEQCDPEREHRILKRWSNEIPTEPGIYWALQAGYDPKRADFKHPPLVKIFKWYSGIVGDDEPHLRVRLLTGGFFHHHGSRGSWWADDPHLSEVIEAYNGTTPTYKDLRPDYYHIIGWQRVEYPAVPEKGEE